MQVSPDSWKDASAHTMKLNQAIIARTDKGIQSSRRTDPLPLLRDACVRESNERIHAYVRATRAVVLQLRKKLVATNEEIKVLSRGKESLERALEHTRKDLALNHQSLEIRGLRPAREKVSWRLNTVTPNTAWALGVKIWGWGWAGLQTIYTLSQL